MRRTACSGGLSSAREKDCDRSPAATLRGRRKEFVGINNCYIDESGVIEPARDVGTVESEPPVVLFCPQPLMSVRIGIRDHEPAAGFASSRHFTDRVCWIRRVVQDHVGEHGIRLARFKRVSRGVAWARFESSAGKPAARLGEHSLGSIDPYHASAGRECRFCKEACARTDIGDDGPGRDPSRANRCVTHTFTEKRAAHVVPLIRNGVEILSGVVVAHKRVGRRLREKTFPYRFRSSNINAVPKCRV